MKFKILCAIALLGAIAVMVTSFMFIDKVEAGADSRPDFTEDMSAMPCCEGPSYRTLGTYRLTAYCSCHKCCGKWAEGRPIDENGNEIVYGAAGYVLSAGHSIAVDPSVIPYGTKVLINGHEYMAMDCGSGIVGQCIDVYFNDHQEALNFGLQYAEVLVEEN